MGIYIERYVYDAVGNFLQMQHRGSGPAGWTRSYAYHEASLIEPGKQSNCLSQTVVGNDNTILETYTHDVHGNMLHMPHLPLMQWDYRDQLQATAKQVISTGGVPETTWYVYDAGGQRVRKVTERQATPGEAPKRIKERIYLGGFEIFRAYENNGDTVTVERETLHIMDDTQRIALIETRIQGNDDSPPQLIRYQLGNHLGSASLELDDQSQIISYEEYTPYGSTSYQAGRSETEVKQKRYRYTGMERDEESGLNYHGARYYAPWLGRWTSCDPASLLDGSNLYLYSHSNPITFSDATGLCSEPSCESDITIIRPGEFTGEESQEYMRSLYAEEGVYYKGEAKWSPELKLWLVDIDQSIPSEKTEDAITNSVPTQEASSTGEYGSTLDAVQMGLDVVGLVPGFGEVADGVNAVISLGRGDYVGAGLSAAAMIPFFGMGATAGKIAKKAYKTPFANLIDVKKFNDNDIIKDRFTKTIQGDIGGHRQLQGSGEFGRVRDGLDSHEVLQNVWVRLAEGVSRNNKILHDNPAIALTPMYHKLIKHLKRAGMEGMSAEEAANYGIKQMVDKVDIINYSHVHELRKEIVRYIGKHGF